MARIVGVELLSIAAGHRHAIERDTILGCRRAGWWSGLRGKGDLGAVGRPGRVERPYAGVDAFIVLRRLIGPVVSRLVRLAASCGHHHQVTRTFFAPNISDPSAIGRPGRLISIARASQSSASIALP